MILGGLFVAAAGLGALVRWRAVVAADRVHWFPWGTLFVNVAGSFVLGWLQAHATNTIVVVAGIGGCGALTTMSGFANDVRRLLDERHLATVLTYIALSVVLCCAAAFVGYVTY